VIGAYASAAIVCAASLLVGWAVLRVCGRGEPGLIGGPVGLAALLAVAGLVTGLGGGGTAVWVGLGVLVVLAAGSLAIKGSRTRRAAGLARSSGISGRTRQSRLWPWVAAGLALLLASLPFIASADVGLLGVGLTNDDMASHLLLADWLETGFKPEPVLVDQGYPLGPHSLVIGLASLLGTGLVEAFAGLLLAVPVLAALAAYAALDGLRPLWRTLAAPLVALPYLVAAYFAQEAFKEPILALLVLGFALLLPATRGARPAVPLGILAAGVVYVYSFPGLAWLVATALVYAAVRCFSAMKGGAPAGNGEPRSARGSALSALSQTLAVAIPAVLAAAVVLLILVLPDIGRVLDFADFRALDPDRANEGGLGNLGGHISPLEALGVWPTSEFRLSAGEGELPAVAFYLGALVGLVALSIGLPGWIRRYGSAVPAALATALVIYVGARAFGTVYTSAKALAIAAPLVTLIALGGLLTSPGPDARGVKAAIRPQRLERLPGRALVAGLFAFCALLSSFLVLRQSPVAPTAHASELEQLRPLLQDENVLFLGRDNFVLYELRGSQPYTHVRNFYDPFYVKPNYELKQVGSKFDWDAVAAEKLDRFPFVITTASKYASQPPPEYELLKETPSYRLWERTAPTVAARTPGETGPAPAGPLQCPDGQGPRGASGTAVILPDPSVLGPASSWSPSATIENGDTATQFLDLSPGRYAISLSYDASRPVTLNADGESLLLPANLDYRGVTPHWPAGEIEVEGGRGASFKATVERPPFAGRLLGANSVAHLNGVVATPIGPGAEHQEVPFDRACAELVDWHSGR
jgi:hypothetical protein